MALDQPLREPDTTRRVSALQTLKHLCTRPADQDKKSLAVSLRSAVLGGLVRGRVSRAGGDGKVTGKAKTPVSREEKAKQQSSEARLDAAPPTPPPSEDVTAEPSPRDAVDFSSLGLGVQDQEQRKEEAFSPMRRRVSFNEVVKVRKPLASYNSNHLIARSTLMRKLEAFVVGVVVSRRTPSALHKRKP